jgi:hypothetical protein
MKNEHPLNIPDKVNEALDKKNLQDFILVLIMNVFEVAWLFMTNFYKYRLLFLLSRRGSGEAHCFHFLIIAVQLACKLFTAVNSCWKHASACYNES